MHESLWSACIQQLEQEVDEQQLNTWIRPLQAQISNGVLRLYAPNRFVYDRVQENYFDRIQ